MKQKVALVLGSGGARGMAHIGVIHEILDRGFEITSVSGTSMGALIGAVYATGRMDEFEKWLTSLSKLDVFNLVDFTLSKSGIIKADRVLKEMQSFIPDQNIEELPIKYSAVATNILNGQEEVFVKGSLYDAVRASISIPLVITPLKKNDTLFVDGGVLNPVPVNRIHRHEDDIMIAVNVNANLPYNNNKNSRENSDKQFNDRLANGKLQRFKEQFAHLISSDKKDSIGYFDLVSETSRLMLSQITRLTLELNPPDLLVEVSREACGTFDFYKASEMINLGRDMTKPALENFSKCL